MDNEKRLSSIFPKGAVTEELKKNFSEKNVVFFIEKSQNTNCVVYEANVVDGKLCKEDPLKAYWILYARTPIIEEGLNLIERNTAYGKTVTPLEGKPGHFTVTLAALSTLKISLFQDETGQVHAQIVDNNETCELLHVYVQVTTYFGMPSVEYIDVRLRKPDSTVFTKRMENNKS